MVWIILWAQPSIPKNRANIPPKMAFTRLRDPHHHGDQYLIERALTQNAVRFHLARTTWGTYASCWIKKFANASKALNKWSSMTNSQNTFCSLGNEPMPLALLAPCFTSHSTSDSYPSVNMTKYSLPFLSPLCLGHPSPLPVSNVT